MRAYEQRETQLKAQQLSDYHKALDEQKRMNDYLKKQFGTMTHTEKKLNKGGLRSYKSGSTLPQKYMVPGLADNSAGVGGSMALKRKGVHQKRASMDFQKIGQESLYHVMSPKVNKSLASTLPDTSLDKV